MTPRLYAIVGPTASGKTALALEVAARVPVEIVSCDSQAVYRGLDLGTAKPTPAERAAVPHHLVDVADPAGEFSAATFVQLADEAIAAIAARGRIPLVVGGTGLYLRSLLRGIFEAPPKDEALRRSLEARAAEEGTEALHRELAVVDPAAAARIPPADLVRIIRALEVHRLTGRSISEHHAAHAGGAPRYRAVVFGVTPPRDELARRVSSRARRMFDEGLADEAAALARDPAVRARLERIMGYREALLLAEGELTREDAIERTRLEQRRFAKRQLTWFRAMPEVEWLEWPPSADAIAARIERT